MKYLQTMIRLSLSVLMFSFCLNIKAQEDSTRLKFSEEIVKEPENKNVKWVKIRPNRYNMDNISSMFKVATSPIYSFASRPVLMVAYEKKIPGSQWSLELKLSTDLSTRSSFYSGGRSSVANQDIQSISEIREYAAMHFTIRHYLFKNRRITQEKSGGNLWGFYGMARLISGVIWSKELETLYDVDLGFSVPIQITERKGLNSNSGYVGLGVGYQQHFLKKGFFDISAGYAKRLVEERYNTLNIFLDLTIGYSIFKVK